MRLDTAARAVVAARDKLEQERIDDHTRAEMSGLLDAVDNLAAAIPRPATGHPHTDKLIAAGSAAMGFLLTAAEDVSNMATLAEGMENGPELDEMAGRLSDLHEAMETELGTAYDTVEDSRPFLVWNREDGPTQAFLVFAADSGDAWRWVGSRHPEIHEWNEDGTPTNPNGPDYGDEWDLVELTPA
jgi:hypothetical protein